MTTSIEAPTFGSHSPDRQPRQPLVMVVVLGVTLAVSVAALLSPVLMNASIRNLPEVRAGQWWRIVTPVLVQPSGWGQLVFNILGLVVVGIALQRYAGWLLWLTIYVVGGVGSSAVLSAWSPTDTGGGSSAAVAALIGSLAVLRFAANGTRGRLESLAELYSVFFVVYLTALAVGGLVPSIIAGNASIVLVVVGHRAWSLSVMTRVCTGVVIIGGVLMFALRDDHGVGILTGVLIAAFVLAHRRLRDSSVGPTRPATAIVSTHKASSPPRPPQSATAAGLWVLIDLIVPVALFYGLRGAGVELFLALVIGAAVPAVAAIIKAVTTRRTDGLAIAVIALLLLSSAISLVTGSPRFLLAKDAGLTAVWGAWFFLSLRARRPLTFRFSRPLLEGRKVFDSVTRTRRTPDAGTWDRLWERDSQFRNVWQVTTVIWGTALFLDAAVRVTMAYTLPIDVVPALAGSLWLVTFLALQLITNIYFVRAGLWKMIAETHKGDGRGPDSVERMTGIEPA
jgi:hypothetical protein